MKTTPTLHKRAPRAAILAGVFSLLLAVLLGGCDLLFMLGESEQEQVQDTAEEWAEVHDLNPVKEEGGIDPEGVAKVARRVVTQSTGDPEVDAALKSDNVILKISKADELVDQGWKENNPRFFDQAIQLRPEEWKYRLDRAAWNLDYYATPNMSKVDKDFQVAESLLGPDKDERLRYANHGIELMEKVKTVMAKPYRKGEQAPLFNRPHDCRTTFTQLAQFYNMRADLTGSDGDREMAAQYQRDLGQCKAWE